MVSQTRAAIIRLTGRLHYRSPSLQAGIMTLQRKLNGMERDIAAIQAKLDDLEREAARIEHERPDEAAEIRKNISQLQEVGVVPINTAYAGGGLKSLAPYSS